MTLGLPLRKKEKTHAMLQHTRFFRPSAGPRSSPPTRPRQRAQPAPPRASRAPLHAKNDSSHSCSLPSTRPACEKPSGWFGRVGLPWLPEV